MAVALTKIYGSLLSSCKRELKKYLSKEIVVTHKRDYLKLPDYEGGYGIKIPYTGTVNLKVKMIEAGGLVILGTDFPKSGKVSWRDVKYMGGIVDMEDYIMEDILWTVKYSEKALRERVLDETQASVDDIVKNPSLIKTTAVYKSILDTSRDYMNNAELKISSSGLGYEIPMLKGIPGLDGKILPTMIFDFANMQYWYCHGPWTYGIDMIKVKLLEDDPVDKVKHSFEGLSLSVKELIEEKVTYKGKDIRYIMR